MANEKNKNSNEPISLSLKVVIYLSIVSGIFIGSWEIVNNIPKYELVMGTTNELFVINKINGNVYIKNKVTNPTYNYSTDEILWYGYNPFNLLGKISETPLKNQNEKNNQTN